MPAHHYDLIVIGSGPAGEKGAVQAAQLGKKVALIEREHVLGGVAANKGSLLSKTLRETALALIGFRQRGLQGVTMTLKEHVTANDFLNRERWSASWSKPGSAPNWSATTWLFSPARPRLSIRTRSASPPTIH
jgi:pyruvate/2-oxoglutarate dehydrogenase complex dihydrolipoamide dehydrogenase (E3) component